MLVRDGAPSEGRCSETSTDAQQTVQFVCPRLFESSPLEAVQLAAQPPCENELGVVVRVEARQSAVDPHERLAGQEPRLPERFQRVPLERR